MFTSYYGMKYNPFTKEILTENAYESIDYKEVFSRLDYLTEVRGMGLFTATSGMGKTFIMRCFVEKLNEDLYKVVYINGGISTIYDLFNLLARQLGVEINGKYKSDMLEVIQSAIKKVVKEDRKIPVIIFDEANKINSDILNELDVLFDFEMGSKNYSVVIILGNENLKEELKKIRYESLKQRITVNYTFVGLNLEEIKTYVESRLSLVNSSKDIFTPEGLNALHLCSNNSPRRLNALITNSLIIGFSKKKLRIDAELIRLAKEEIDL